MKVYVIAGLILIAGIAAVWVVVSVVFSGNADDSAYSIPPGRYDCFLPAFSSLYKSSHFPGVQGRSGPFPSPRKTTYSESRELLGMKFTIGADAKNLSSAKFAVEDGFRRIEQIEEMASLARTDSELSKLNRQAGDRAVVMSEELYFVMKRAMDISERSRGAFDVTIAPLKQVWQKYSAQGVIPPSDDITEAMALTGYKFIQIDPKKRTIRFKKKGLSVDLSDIIGGFAMDQVIRTLKSDAIAEGFVRVNDSFRFVPHEEEGAYCTLGIPDARGELRYTYVLDRPASVTKGYYTGYSLIGSTVVSNIVDPRSGNCIGGVPACTVIGPDAMTCDAMATALCVLGSGGEARNFLAQYNPKEEEPKAKTPTEEPPTP